MIIKVCGMREAENINQVSTLGIDWMGFIFYPGSPRYAGNITLPSRQGTTSPKRVGVFVNTPVSEMLAIAERNGLDYLQLHGNESPEICRMVKTHGYGVIKAFAIATETDLSLTRTYERAADYFLFDARSENFGGSGQSFDWGVLNAYQGPLPFLLSGGISPGSIGQIRDFRHPHLAGIDLNSGFETSPGHKNIEELARFIHQIKQIKH